MQTAINIFRENIRRSRDLVAIFHSINVSTTEALEITDVLRASFVMSVSALDHFVHEIVRIGMLEAFRAERVRTSAFLRFQVTIGSVLRSSGDPRSEEWLEQEIRERHGYQSFEMPDRIADGIRLISDVTLWDEVARSTGKERKEIRDNLSLIIQRRNKIVHEADITPDYARQRLSDLRSPIDEALVENTIQFISLVAEAIYTLVSPKQPVVDEHII